jgi:hypothetical protein
MSFLIGQCAFQEKEREREKTKANEDGSIQKYKARLIEIFAPVAWI